MEGVDSLMKSPEHEDSWDEPVTTRQHVAMESPETNPELLCAEDHETMQTDNGNIPETSAVPLADSGDMSESGDLPETESCMLNDPSADSVKQKTEPSGPGDSNNSPEQIQIKTEPCETSPDSPDGNGYNEKARRRRPRPPFVPLKDDQLKGLEDCFRQSAYPKRMELFILAEKIGLDFTRVNNWFKNQRQKMSRIKRGMTPEMHPGWAADFVNGIGDDSLNEPIQVKQEKVDSPIGGVHKQSVNIGESTALSESINGANPLYSTPRSRLPTQGHRRVLYKGLSSPKTNRLQKKWKHASSSLKSQGSKFSIYNSKRNPISMKKRRRRKKKLPPVPDAAATFERLKAVGWSPSKEPPDVQVPVHDLHALLTCGICHGYLFNATTLTECLHTFCKSCIVKHIQHSRQCPVCQLIIHPSNPTFNMRSDSTIQDIVYKVFPHVEEAHSAEQKEFYESRGIAWPPRPKTPELPPLERHKEEEDYGKEQEEDESSAAEPGIPNGLLYILLDYIGASPGMGQYKPLVKRHLLVPSQATVGHLEKFLEQKLCVPTFARVRVFISTFQLKSAVALIEVAGAFPEHCPKVGLLEVDYGVVVRQPTPVKKRHMIDH